MVIYKTAIELLCLSGITRCSVSKILRNISSNLIRALVMFWIHKTSLISQTEPLDQPYISDLLRFYSVMKFQIRNLKVQLNCRTDT